MSELLSSADDAGAAIRRTKLFEQLALHLQERIRSGDLRPGDQLPAERVLMTSYGVGRPAVREALLALEARGLIKVENGRRARVCSPSASSIFSSLDPAINLLIDDPSNLRRLFESRILLEAAIAREAAKSIDDAGVAELRRLLDANKSAIGKREFFMATDAAFHRHLVSVLGNPVLNQIYAGVVHWLMERWRQIKRTRATEQLAYDEHAEIFKAVAAHDADKAEQAMRRHLSRSWSIWAAQLGRR